MNESTLDELRDHYDNTDETDALSTAELDPSTDPDPMVGITVRLPASTLNAARAVAAQRGMRVTALLREWTEQQLADEVSGDQVVPVADLRRLIAHSTATKHGVP